MQLPFHDDDGRLAGVVDVLEERVLRYADDGSGRWSPEPIPTRLRTSRAMALEAISEAVAGTDDVLLEAFLEYLELEIEPLKQGLKRAVISGALVPILMASGASGLGGSAVLDAMVDWLPAPVPEANAFRAQVLSRHHDSDGKPYVVLRVLSGQPSRKAPWIHPITGARTRIGKLYQLRGERRSVFHGAGAGAVVATWDALPGVAGDCFVDRPDTPHAARPDLPPPQLVWTFALPEKKTARERVQAAAARLAVEDRGLQLELATGGGWIRGLGQAHLERSMDVLRRETGLRLSISLPPVAYREAPRKSVHGVEAAHRRVDSDGLVAEFGACALDLDPDPGADSLQFTDALDASFDFDLPTRYRPSIQEGVQLAGLVGCRGYPVVGARVRLIGGDHNCLVSTEAHFVQAGALALRRALEKADTFLLEPWSHIEVAVQSGRVGEVMADISSRRGRIVGLDTVNPKGVILALCPDVELRTFAVRLQAMSGGRGRFTRRASHYAPLPAHLESQAHESGRASSSVPPVADWNKAAC
jgi:elongation factor G